MSVIARWTLRGFPGSRHIDPDTTEVVAGPPVPVGEAIEVVRASQLEGAVDLLREARNLLHEDGTENGVDRRFIEGFEKLEAALRVLGGGQ